ncbi:MAG TPA: ribonuclease H-like domain-containing protein [Candidatus Paceibacterota bacterium]|nr:ribonuclease H-like domain-containing protein [Candidatus Paceibacterota bacterium]
MSTLIFDIETVGEDFDQLDATTQEVLTKWIKTESESDDEYEHALENLKNELGFSPLTGQIVAIGVLDAERGKGAVFYQSKKGEKEMEEGGIKFKPMSEKEMLEAFWEGAKEYDEFVSFNGRMFDAPFLAVRSAIHGVRPSCDLLSNRYTSLQRGVRHVDLRDQLSFYGAMRRPGSLHLWCRAFGIESPKGDISGDDVAGLFKAGKCLEIAKYNVGDLHATKALYDKWKTHLRF